MENEAMMDKYETLSTDLLEWIKRTISELNDRNFQVGIRLFYQTLLTVELC